MRCDRRGVDRLTAIAIIPARYGASRFPGKPLALLAGKPMIQWVYERACAAGCFNAVIVATDDARIADVVKGFGGIAQMTGEHHPSGTDRVWEAAQAYPDADIIFNIQGDEPLLDPLCLEEACRALSSDHEHTDIITLCAPIHDTAELSDPNTVKVALAADGRALYFSRAGIPHCRDVNNETLEERLTLAKRHIGIYGFRRNSLARFVSLSVSPLEQCEKLEQLRALEAGMTIRAITVKKTPQGVDTPEDLVKAERILMELLERKRETPA